MYKLTPTTKFKKDLKKVKKKPQDFRLTADLLHILQEKGVEGVPLFMKPHKLTGNFKDNWECHIKSDLLIIWMQFESPNIIKLVRLGTHSELFK